MMYSTGSSTVYFAMVSGSIVMMVCPVVDLPEPTTPAMMVPPPSRPIERRQTSIWSGR